MKLNKIFLISILIFATLTIPFMGMEYLMSFLNLSKSGTRRLIRLKELAPSSDIIFSFPEEPEGKELAARVKLITDKDGYILPNGSEESIQNPIEILFLGGSTTECLRVEGNKRFPYLVAKELNDKYKKEKISFKSLNSGVSGNNSMHSNLILLSKGIKNRPEFAIMMHGINDLSILTQQTVYQSYWNNNFARSILVDSSYEDALLFPLKRFLPYTSENIIKPAYQKFIRFQNKDDFKNSRLVKINIDPEQIKKDYESSIKTFIYLAKNWGIEPVLMTQPNIFSNNPKNWVIEQVNSSVKNLYLDGSSMKYKDYKNIYDEFNNIIRKLSEKENVKLIDLANEIPQNGKYMYDLIHLNQEGSKLVSKIIVKELTKSDFILRSYLMSKN